MKLIRLGTFETNSSSCHSITIQNSNGVYNDIPSLDESGNLLLTSHEFGCEIDDYYGFDAKAAYLAVYLRDWSGVNQEQFKATFENVLKEVTGAESIIYEKNFWRTEERSYVSNDKTVTYQASLGEGYIDHQSVECGALDYIFQDIEEMKNFLFNSSSELHTDNDSH